MITVEQVRCIYKIVQADVGVSKQGFKRDDEALLCERFGSFLKTMKSDSGALSFEDSKALCAILLSSNGIYFRRGQSDVGMAIRDLVCQHLGLAGIEIFSKQRLVDTFPCLNAMVKIYDTLVERADDVEQVRSELGASFLRLVEAWLSGQAIVTRAEFFNITNSFKGLHGFITTHLSERSELKFTKDTAVLFFRPDYFERKGGSYVINYEKILAHFSARVFGSHMMSAVAEVDVCAGVERS